MTMKKICCFTLFYMLSSCYTTGKNFPSKLGWIEKDKTTKKDVSLVLGKPALVGNSGGSPTSTYSYYRFVLFGQSKQKELKLYWNTDGTVKHFSFNSSFPEDLAP